MSVGSFAAIVTLLAVFAAGGFYIYTKTRGDTSRFFAPRVRRLAFVERAHLDNGRKLVLVRRDGVEHLLLIGGPIDLVVETGIRPENLASIAAAEDVFQESYTAAAGPYRQPGDPLPPKTAVPAEPRLPLSADVKEIGEDMLELTQNQETKAV